MRLSQDRMEEMQPLDSVLTTFGTEVCRSRQIRRAPNSFVKSMLTRKPGIRPGTEILRFNLEVVDFALTDFVEL